MGETSLSMQYLQSVFHTNKLCHKDQHSNQFQSNSIRWHLPNLRWLLIWRKLKLCTTVTTSPYVHVKYLLCWDKMLLGLSYLQLSLSYVSKNQGKCQQEVQEYTYSSGIQSRGQQHSKRPFSMSMALWTLTEFRRMEAWQCEKKDAGSPHAQYIFFSAYKTSSIPIVQKTTIY